MEVDNGGTALPYTSLNLTHYEVEVDGLAEFRELLGRELDANLRPAVEGIRSDHILGVGFGHANPGTEVRLAQEKYRHVLEGSTRVLATYIAVAEELNAAIARIADNYRDADLTSAAMAQTVRDELALATAQAHETIRKAELEAQRMNARLNAGRL